MVQVALRKWFDFGEDGFLDLPESVDEIPGMHMILILSCWLTVK